MNMPFIHRTACLGGWSLVAALSFSHPKAGPLILVGFFAALTLQLSCCLDHPVKTPTLTLSWIGPLIVALWFIPEYLISGFSRTLNSDPMSVILVGSSALKGVFVTLFAVWILRGYGIILILSFLQATFRRRQSANFEELFDKYPLKRWWLIPFFLFIFYALLTACWYIIYLSLIR